jgi:hypothetical protein
VTGSAVRLAAFALALAAAFGVAYAAGGAVDPLRPARTGTSEQHAGEHR